MADSSEKQRIEQNKATIANAKAIYAERPYCEENRSKYQMAINLRYLAQAASFITQALGLWSSYSFIPLGI